MVVYPIVFRYNSVGDNHERKHIDWKIHRFWCSNSKADFIAKLHIALKETAETEYWLHILKKTDYLDESMASSLLKDCLEIKKILIASINTAKERQN